jgi:hypothetical protein
MCFYKVFVIELEVDYPLQGHRRINPAVIGRHGVIDPVNIQSAQIDTPIAAVAVKNTPHQNILHLHGQTKNGYRHTRFEHAKLGAESARMKRQEAAVGSLTLNNRNDYRKAIISNEG